MGRSIVTWELLRIGYVIGFGFVAAGVLGSLYQLVTQRPPSFIVSLETWGTLMMSMFVCAFAGPFIIMRNAVRGRRLENRPLSWLMVSSLIAIIWSFCSGLVMIDLTLSVTP